MVSLKTVYFCLFLLFSVNFLQFFVSVFNIFLHLCCFLFFVFFSEGLSLTKNNSPIDFYQFGKNFGKNNHFFYNSAHLI